MTQYSLIDHYSSDDAVVGIITSEVNFTIEEAKSEFIARGIATDEDFNGGQLTIERSSIPVISI